MSPKCLLATCAAALLLGTPLAPAATFDLGANGKLSVALPDTWIAKARPLGTCGYDIRFRPQADSDIQINFTVIYPASETAPDRARALATFRQLASQAAEGSVEKQADVKELSLPDGFAFYASFTDERLVGHEPEPGDWKTATPCMMVLGGKLVVVATIFSDDFQSTDFARAMSVLRSVQLTPGG